MSILTRVQIGQALNHKKLVRRRKSVGEVRVVHETLSIRWQDRSLFIRASFSMFAKFDEAIRPTLLALRMFGV